MQTKKKKCDGCQTDQHIWKRFEGKKYCKSCWAIHPNRDKKSQLKQTKKLNPISNKQEKLNAAYSVLRKIFLEQNPFCKAKLNGCTLLATDVHHMAGRGIFMLDTTLFLSVCRSCHGILETNPIMAKELGFSVSREEIRKKDEQ